MDHDLGKEIGDAVKEALKKRGRVNVLIAGRSGVGKSTLINAVFQGRIATTGQGRPVTKETREYNKEGIPVSIFDTRGLEMEKFKETLGDLADFVSERSSDPDPTRHIHVAWLCISEDSRRVEDGESKTVDLLAQHVPVVGVVTKARSDQGFRAKVQELLPKVGNVVRVRAIGEELDEGHTLSPFGLDNLVDLTMELVPEAQRQAFAAAQKVSLDHKKNQAHAVVVGAAATAAGIGAVPIPFSDAALLIPVQVGMLAGVSAVFGLNLTKAFLSTLVGSAVTALGVTYAGRALASGLLKLIPGVGSFTGGAIAAATAATLTTTVGEIYLAVLVKLFDESGGDLPTDAAVAKAFSASLSRKKGKRE